MYQRTYVSTWDYGYSGDTIGILTSYPSRTSLLVIIASPHPKEQSNFKLLSMLPMGYIGVKMSSILTHQNPVVNPQE